MLGIAYDVNEEYNDSIAGIDCMRFEGTTPNETVSYSVIGIVTPKEQEQSMIDEMKQEVDVLMASIHDEN